MWLVLGLQVGADLIDGHVRVRGQCLPALDAFLHIHADDQTVALGYSGLLQPIHTERVKGYEIPQRPLYGGALRALVTLMPGPRARAGCRTAVQVDSQ